MSLAFEDGSGISGAESYISVFDADTYHDLRANNNWFLLDSTQKEQALRRATDFMMGRYRGQWKGRRVNSIQSLDWPRIGVLVDDIHYLDYTIVPKEVKYACAELGLRAAAGPLLEDVERKVHKEIVGPITTEYDKDAPVIIQYAQVDAMLRVYLGRGGNSAMVKLTRC